MRTKYLSSRFRGYTHSVLLAGVAGRTDTSHSPGDDGDRAHRQDQRVAAEDEAATGLGNDAGGPNTKFRSTRRSNSVPRSLGQVGPSPIESDTILAVDSGSNLLEFGSKLAETGQCLRPSSATVGPSSVEVVRVRSQTVQIWSNLVDFKPKLAKLAAGLAERGPRVGPKLVNFVEVGRLQTKLPNPAKLGRARAKVGQIQPGVGQSVASSTGVGSMLAKVGLALGPETGLTIAAETSLRFPGCVVRDVGQSRSKFTAAWPIAENGNGEVRAKLGLNRPTVGGCRAAPRTKREAKLAGLGPRFAQVSRRVWPEQGKFGRRRAQTRRCRAKFGRTPANSGESRPLLTAETRQNCQRWPKSAQCLAKAPNIWDNIGVDPAKFGRNRPKASRSGQAPKIGRCRPELAWSRPKLRPDSIEIADGR